MRKWGDGYIIDKCNQSVPLLTADCIAQTITSAINPKHKRYGGDNVECI